jgi:release factor glutamine methyltransferase
MNRALVTRTVGAALTEAIRRLRLSGSPTPRLDAELLLAHVTGHDRSWVHAHPEAELGEATAFAAALDRRARGEPIAYIRGFKEWRSLRIRTDSRALIPRPETELLADVAMAEVTARLARDGEPIVVWEVATGSGAVAVALALRFRSALELGRLTLIASDASPEALELASENLAEHGVDRLVTLADADLLEPAGGALPRPGIVVANLPYVTSAEVDTRWGSLGHEPRLALDGGPDGLVLLRRLLADLPTHAAPGATALLEIGAGQVAAVASLAPVGASISALPDLAGLDRVMRFDLP